MSLAQNLPDSSSDTPAKLEVKGLTCIRDDRVLFRGLDFSLEPGQALQIEGPNGSGKTTMLRTLCGLTLPSDGEILWNGEAIEDVRPEYMAAMDFIGHAHGIKKELTPLENLQVALAMADTNPNQSLEGVLEKVGLKGFEDVPAITLSAGQCRRVALGRLLLSKSILWILDEPFTALDVQGQAQIESMLVNHVENGGMVILTSHHPLALKDGMLKTINLRP
ncbi:MAG: cytochrome c biogenesis heme-transporting ATPase CcmA [Gammaproteobacteria bacterium]|nr:cytochrome c biogenesis heme-transporting ATPase CcmA [Gammaproteobacteria bacterium]